MLFSYKYIATLTYEVNSLEYHFYFSSTKVLAIMLMYWFMLIGKSMSTSRMSSIIDYVVFVFECYY